MTFDITHQSLNKQRSWRIGRLIIFIFVIGICLWGGHNYVKESWGVFAVKTDLASNLVNIFAKYLFIILALERAAALWVGLDRTVKRREWEMRVIRMRKFLKMPDPDSVSPVTPTTLTDLKQMYHRESKIISDINANAAMGNGFLGIIDPYVDSDRVPYGKGEEEKEALFSYARIVKQIYEFEHANYEAQTNKLITRIVFVGGVVLAFVGISVLGDILDLDQVYGLANTANGTKISSELLNQTSQFWYYRIADILITTGLIGGGSKSLSIFVEIFDRAFTKKRKPGKVNSLQLEE